MNHTDDLIATHQRNLERYGEGSVEVTRTRVEIDTALYALYVQHQSLAQDMLHAVDGLHYGCDDTRDYGYGRRGTWNLSDDEALAACQALVADEAQPGYKIDKADKALAKVERVDIALADNRAKAMPGEAEYIRSGRWARAFLVTDGHVHRGMDCSTCFPTTGFTWITSLSDHDEAEIVEAAAERACTVCYPSAPTLRSFERASALFTEEEAERNAKREVAKAEKAARTQAKIEKGLTADGSPFEVRYLEPDFAWVQDPNSADPNARIRQDTERPRRQEFKTERAAELWYVSELAEVVTWGHKRITESQYDALGTIVYAIAAKHGETMPDVKARLDAKVAAKIKRDTR